MGSSYVTVSVILYNSKTLSNGEQPLMLRLAQKASRKLKSLGLSCHPKYWNYKKNHPNREKLETIIKKELAQVQRKILEVRDKESCSKIRFKKLIKVIVPGEKNEYIT